MTISASRSHEMQGFRYRNIQPLERISGTMADIYLADLADANSSKVVLKVAQTSPENTEISRQMLIAEIEYLRRISHPHIVRILPIEQNDVRQINYRSRSTWEGRPWFGVLEWIQGNTLQHFLQDKIELSPCIALEIGRQMLLALDYLHTQHKLVHMDLKPSHILFRQEPTSLQSVSTVLIDFGSACSIDTQFTETATIQLNRYLSPERIESMNKQQAHQAKPSEDIYILGLILYQTITNQLPFPQNDPADKVNAMLTEMPPAPSTKLTIQEDRRVQIAWRQIDQLLLKMLNRQPTARPTARQLALDLREILFWLDCYTETKAVFTPLAQSGKKDSRPNPRHWWQSVGILAIGMTLGYGLNTFTDNTFLPMIAATATATATVSATATLIPTDTPYPTSTETPIPTATNTIEPTSVPTVTILPPTTTLQPTSTRAAITPVPAQP